MPKFLMVCIHLLVSQAIVSRGADMGSKKQLYLSLFCREAIASAAFVSVLAMMLAVRQPNVLEQQTLH